MSRRRAAGTIGQAEAHLAVGILLTYPVSVPTVAKVVLSAYIALDSIFLVCRKPSSSQGLV